MKKILKWAGILLLSLALIASSAVLYFKTKADKMAEERHNPEIALLIDIPTDSISLERGRILSVGCQDCHGHDYAGKDFFNDPMIGFMASPNLTPSKGSAVELYETKDWIKALRHGLNPEGRPLMVMPSESIGQLSDRDLGCLISYLKTLEPIVKPLGPTNFSFMAKAMLGAGLFGNLYPYDIIEHESVKSIKAPAVSNLPEYGEYFAKFKGCKSCHGDELNGAKSPDPVSPAAANITSGGNLGKWSLQDFILTMRSGTTPEGKFLKPDIMPWVGLSVHSDTELEALFNYLKAQPSLDDSEEIKP